MIADLATAAVACPGWRWMEGMLTQDGKRLVKEIVTSEMGGETCTLGLYRSERALTEGREFPGPGDRPDFSDAATAGCLPKLVRDAYDDPYVCCLPVFDALTGQLRGWVVRGTKIDIISTGHTEIEALVAALTAAPCC